MSRDVPLQLYSYDDRWRQEFEQARSLILFAAEGAIGAVEHIGATAIPGMSSLPCIDMVAAVDDAEEIERTLPYLRGLDYCPRPAPFEDADCAVYLVKPKGLLASFSVTLVELGGEAWSRRLMIRDWLRTREEAAESYLRLRRQRLSAAPEDREGYERAKATFLQHIADQADAHFRDST